MSEEQAPPRSTGEYDLVISARLLDEEPGYRVLRRLGRGAMSVVYEVERASDGQPFALKLCRTNPSTATRDLHRFQRECRAMAMLSHPHLVRMYGSGILDPPDAAEGPRPYMVLELITGRTLRDAIPELYRMSQASRVERAVQIAREICSALAYVHRKRLVHRDLKPGNVLLDGDGRVKVSDFGVVRDLDANVELTRGGELVGTVAYMAPEQADAHPIDGRSDLYSLGVMLYEMLAGQRPFVADQIVAMLYQHAMTPPPLLRNEVPAVPDALSQIVDRLLAKKPEDRFPTAAAVRAALDAALPPPLLDADEVAEITDGDFEEITEEEAEHEPLLRAPLVGRGEVMRQLHRGLDAAKSGTAAWLVLRGGPPMGEGQVLDTLCADARQRGMRVLRGREIGRGHVPFGPFSAIMDQAAVELEQLVARDVREARSLLRRVGPQLASTFRGFASEAAAGGDADPDAAQRRLRAAVRQVLELLAGEAGLLIVVESHDAEDVESEALLTYLGEQLVRDGVRVMLLCTETEGSRSEPLRDRAEAVELRALTVDEVGELISGMVGGPVSADLARRLHALTAGTPLAIVETTRYLTQQGTRLDTAAGTEALRLPSNVRKLHELRMSGLGPSARRIVEITAVLSSPWRFDLMRNVVHFVDGEDAASEGRLIDGINELMSAHMLIEVFAGQETAVAAGGDTGVIYTVPDNPLLEAVYAAMPPPRRIALHGAAGEAIARASGGVKGPEVVRVSEHLDEGGRKEDAARYMLAAIRRWAALGLSRQQAMGFLDRVEQLLAGGEGEARAALRERALYLRAQTLLRLGELAEAEEAAGRYRDLTDGADDPARHTARWRVICGNSALLQGRPEDAQAHFEAAMQASQSFGEADDEGAALSAEATLGLGSIAMHRGDFESAEGWMTQLAASRGADLNPLMRSKALSGQASMCYYCGDLERARTLAKLSSDAASRVGALERTATGRIITASAETLMARFDNALREAESALDLSITLEERRLICMALQTLAEVHIDAGQIERGWRLLDPAGENAAHLADLEDFGASYDLLLWMRARALMALHRYEESRDVLLSLVERMDRFDLPVVAAELAWAEAECGEDAAAQSRIEGALQEVADERFDRNVPARVETYRAASEVVRLCGDPERALQLADSAEGLAAEKRIHGLLVRALASGVAAAEAARQLPRARELRGRGRELLDRVTASLSASVRESYRGRPEVRTLLED